MGLSPRNEALAFRVWNEARAHEWNVTLLDLAETLGVSWQRIAVVCRVKGWTGRLRPSPHLPKNSVDQAVYMGFSFDRFDDADAATLADFNRPRQGAGYVTAD